MISLSESLCVYYEKYLCVDLAKGMCLERFLFQRWWARIDCTSGPPDIQVSANLMRQGQMANKHHSKDRYQANMARIINIARTIVIVCIHPVQL